jgi:hypothetical protein
MTLKEILDVVCDWSLYGCDKHKIALNELHRYKNILSEIPETKEGVPFICRTTDDQLVLCKVCSDDDDVISKYPYPADDENYPVACQQCQWIFSR